MPVALRWRPHTEVPDLPGPLTAVIAVATIDAPDKRQLLSGVYEWRDGGWYDDVTGRPLGRALPCVCWWWLPEDELVATIPGAGQ